MNNIEKSPLINIVLVEPLIPQNTGSIARLTAALYCNLHLIEPLGFSLDDRYLKRAGLDYWSEVKLHIHKDWQSFLSANNISTDQLWFFTTKAEKDMWNAEFKDGDYLVFGNESFGLNKTFHEQYSDRRIKIYQPNSNVRSQNLANSVSIGLYEAIRQIKK